MITHDSRFGILALASVLCWSSPDLRAQSPAAAGPAVDTARLAAADVRTLSAFAEERIECDRYVFPPGAFPSIRWENDLRVRNEAGNVPLSVTYYNNAMQPVARADSPGRYGAVVEGKTPSGFVIRRYVTLFCSAVEFDDYSPDVPVTIEPLKGYGIAPSRWKQYAANKERFSFGNLKYLPQRDADAAIFLAGLNDGNDTSGSFDTPRIRDRQWWITLKGRLEGSNVQRVHLSQPVRVRGETSVPMELSAAVPPLDDTSGIEKIRTVCRTWAEKSGVPHVTLVARHGRIVFHEAFGTDTEGVPITKDRSLWMASITKLLTGLLMMQFVDQGIVDLDAPVGRYLPELAGPENDRLTVRRLFTHTSGLHVAGEWASDWNPALENQVAQVLPSVEVGKKFSYHRAGYALAGRIMERMTGRAVPYLFREYLFAPLGMRTAYSDNTYGGLYCSALDLARVGQLLLHKGTYNGVRFFSAQSFEKMLPAPLPVSDRRWGIGTTPMGGNGLSESAFGHAAASGTIFRVDPRNDLVIVSARNRPGTSHDEFANALIESCTALVRNH